MTVELKNECSQALDDAIESGDENQVLRALARSNKALMECQLKTSNRVKNLVHYFWVFATFVAVAFFGNSELAMKIVSIFVKG